MAPDAAVLPDRVGLFAEFNKRVLPGKALPTLGGYPRRIDSACGSASGIARRTVGHSAIARARYPQVSGQRDLFGCVCHVRANDRGSAWRVASLAARR